MTGDYYADRLFNDYLGGCISRKDLELFFDLIESLSDDVLKERFLVTPGCIVSSREVFAADRKELVKKRILSQIIAETQVLKATLFSCRQIYLWPGIAALVILIGSYLTNNFQFARTSQQPEILWSIGHSAHGQTMITIASTRYCINTRRSFLKITGDKLLISGLTKNLSLPSDEILVIRTSAQSICALELADKSKVTINTGITLSLLEQCGQPERSLRLRGEAFFEVRKDCRPFRVFLSNSTVKVLGTDFNVNNYRKANQTRVTLVNGSIDYVTSQSRNFIKPGEQALSNLVGRVDTRAVLTDTVLARKDGLFDFNGKPITEALREACIWYNIKLRMLPGLSHSVLTGKMSRTSKLGTLINYINKIYPVNLLLEGDVLTISPKRTSKLKS